MEIDNIIQKIHKHPWKTPRIRIAGSYVETKVFAESCLLAKNRGDLATKYSCSKATISHAIQRAFPEFEKKNTRVDKKILYFFNIQKCMKCGSLKDFEDFHAKNSSTVGISDWCKDCTSQSKKSYIKTESFQEWNEEYRKKPGVREKKAGYCAKYRAKKLQRTPPWADHSKIEEIYLNCPEGYHVDHIIPLQGELVSGLHVPENLQYLTPYENLTKSNKYIPQ